jgi:lantibiotic modifying enzyme
VDVEATGARIDPARGRAPDTGVLEPDWWVRGLAPDERPAGADANSSTTGTLPAWAAAAERAVRAAEVGPAPDGVGDTWEDAFASILRPLVAGARRRVLDRATDIGGPAPVNAVGIADGFAAHLSRRLVRTAARTLVLELNLRRTGGRLAGTDGRQRFADFVRQAATPQGLAELFGTYPVLARLLAETTLAAADAHAELLGRYAVDRAAIVETLLDGADPGPLNAVDQGLGDAHRGGRSVCVLTFDSGARVVYKPRDVATHRLFAALVGWLNEAVPHLGLGTAATLVRTGYGWQEFVADRPLAGPPAVERFYRRQGALLALLHAVHGCDMHHGNLVACGDQPLLVDLETLLHPVLPRPEHAADPAARTLAESVHRTSMLPFAIAGERGTIDPSALGGDAAGDWPESAAAWADAGTDRMHLTRRPVPFRGGRNRPRLARAETTAGATNGATNGAVAGAVGGAVDGVSGGVEPADHVEALLGGFRPAYDAIARGRREFAELLAGCGGTSTRIVGRPSRVYAELLDETTHPELLQDAADREEALGVLATLAADPLRQALVPYEIADLRAGDVPLFLARPGSPDVWTSTGQRLPGLLGPGGLAATRERVDALGEADRQRQEWIISATLATRRPWPDGGDEPMPGPLTRTVAEPANLLAAACGIADQLVARSLSDRDRVSWLGLDLSGGRWTVSPLGAGLGTGYTGVALFLAQMAALTGVARYRDVARQALTPVPNLCDALAGRPDLARAAGVGAYGGLGGVAYALARIGVLLDDPPVRDWAGRVVRLIAATVEADPDGPPGVANGTAGCLAAMTAVNAELGLDEAAGLAARCAGRLAERVRGLDRPPAGFADGAAGIGWALARYAGDDAELGRAARSALALAGPPADGGHGWYAGTAGFLAARAGHPAVPDADPAAGDAETAARALAARPVRRDLSLRTGELGIAEALTLWSGPGSHRGRAGLILDAVRRHGPCCGTPGRVPTPGLLSGLAGIGYGLLRLGFPGRVPSVLLAEPAVAKETAPPQAEGKDHHVGPRINRPAGQR